MRDKPKASRILIIGSGGAGKSTVARELSERLRLPLIPLDTLYWRAGWDPTPSPEWESRVRELAPQQRRGPILERLAALRDDQNVVILTSPAAVREFLDAYSTHG